MAKKRKLIYELYSPSFLHPEHFETPLMYLRHTAVSVDYRLHPDYFWLTPFYESGGADGGYDIVDLMRIDPRYGTLGDFKALIAEPALQDKVMLDIVLNHCSTKSQLFQQDLRCSSGPTNCIWREKPNNWDSLFGGSAWELSSDRNEYYLHLFTPDQPDLNWNNMAVAFAFCDDVAFWYRQGVAGFRIDTCNILRKQSFNDSPAPALKGFEYYHQRGSAEILHQVFGRFPVLFTMGEMVGGNIAELRELSGPLDCCLNAAVNDAADGLFIGPRKELDYKAWFESLLQWSEVPGFVLQLESHDFPRSPSRFRANPRALALLQFFLPFDTVCIYQGQELGLHNPSNIQDPTARENARIPAGEIFGTEYQKQSININSTLHLYEKLIELWRTDPVLLYGETKVQYIGADGIFRFTRRFGQREWLININLTPLGESYAIDGDLTIC